MQPFVINRHDRIVFPSNLVPELDLSTIDSLEQLDAVIRRDFETKASTGTDILRRVEEGGYRTRYELMRDVALNMFWTGRFALTMYDKRPTRWADVPRRRDDVFLPVLTPWQDGERKVAAVRAAFEELPSSLDAAVEEDIWRVLFDVFGHRQHHATELSAVKPTVADMLADPSNLTFRLRGYDADYPTYRLDEIVDAHEEHPELEALRRWSMVLHNQYPWDRSQAELVEVGQLRDDDYVVVFHPRDQQVRRFLNRLDDPPRSAPAATAPAAVAPVSPYEPVDVRARFDVMPRIEALAVVHGERACSNEDVIRNSAYNWSPMAAQEIFDKTGIKERRYTSLSLEEMSLQAARAALDKAGRGPEDVGAVLVCTCTSTRMIPSVATYVSGQLGIQQTHASYDLIAACAGLPYGLSDAVRLLQEVQRPVLVICVEKFSDKIGNVRTSRMIFGDGAAAIVVGVAPDGAEPDVEWLQTYASGPASEVNSIIWPNPEFDNNITVYGPEVKSLAGRYLVQMIEEISALPAPAGAEGSLLDNIDLIVPHQANKTMVQGLAQKAGLPLDGLYFNIEDVGNTSSASIPLALHDAVRDGVISSPVRVFAPGFGAGAVAGYSVMRIDPAVVAVSSPDVAQAQPEEEPGAAEQARPAEHPAQSSDDLQVAFG